MFTSAGSFPLRRTGRRASLGSAPWKAAAEEEGEHGKVREEERAVRVDGHKGSAVAGSKQSDREKHEYEGKTDGNKRESVAQEWIVLQEAHARIL